MMFGGSFRSTSSRNSDDENEVIPLVDNSTIIDSPPSSGGVSKRQQTALQQNPQDDYVDSSSNNNNNTSIAAQQQQQRSSPPPSITATSVSTPLSSSRTSRFATSPVTTTPTATTTTTTSEAPTTTFRSRKNSASGSRKSHNNNNNNNNNHAAAGNQRRRHRQQQQQQQQQRRRRQRAAAALLAKSKQEDDEKKDPAMRRPPLMNKRNTSDNFPADHHHHHHPDDHSETSATQQGTCAETCRSITKSTLNCMNCMAKVLVWCSMVALVATVVWYSYELKNNGTDPHLIAWFSAGAFVLLGFPISMWGIVSHLANYNQPHVQCYIVRILWMVPIYSIESWLCLRFHEYAIYIETLRDCYESFVLYSFLQFLIQILGGEKALILMLKDKSPTRGVHMWGLQWCVKPWLMGQPIRKTYESIHSAGNSSAAVELGPTATTTTATTTSAAANATMARQLQRQQKNNSRRTLKRVHWTSPFFVKCKFGVLQYVLLKFVSSIFVMILELNNLYKEGDFTPKGGYLYICILTNLSQCWALYCLIFFYYATQTELANIRPVGKFLSVKALVFFTWWQSVAISIFYQYDMIPHYQEENWTSADVAKGIQDYLICIEMFIAAIIHSFVFPHHEYSPQAIQARASALGGGGGKPSSSAYDDRYQRRHYYDNKYYDNNQHHYHHRRKKKYNKIPSDYSNNNNRGGGDDYYFGNYYGGGGGHSSGGSVDGSSGKKRLGRRYPHTFLSAPFYSTHPNHHNYQRYRRKSGGDTTHDSDGDLSSSISSSYLEMTNMGSSSWDHKDNAAIAYNNNSNSNNNNLETIDSQRQSQFSVSSPNSDSQQDRRFSNDSLNAAGDVDMWLEEDTIQENLQSNNDNNSNDNNMNNENGWESFDSTDRLHQGLDPIDNDVDKAEEDEDDALLIDDDGYFSNDFDEEEEDVDDDDDYNNDYDVEQDAAAASANRPYSDDLIGGDGDGIGVFGGDDVTASGASSAAAASTASLPQEDMEMVVEEDSSSPTKRPNFVRALLDSAIPVDLRDNTVGIVKGDYVVERKTLLHHAATSDSYDLFSDTRRRTFSNKYHQQQLQLQQQQQQQMNKKDKPNTTADI